jgi:molecular chaperone GrpE
MSEELNQELNSEQPVEQTSEEVFEATNKINYEQKIEELQNEVENWKDKFLRKAAEFENYKKRTENDQLNLVTYAAESFIKKILPIVDDFERSLEHINDSNDFEKLKEGVNLIYNKLIKVLEEQGVKKIESIGKPFDVQFHEALMQKTDNSVPPHTVLEELEKGYIYKDKVIRHSKVIVSSEEQTEN